MSRNKEILINSLINLGMKSNLSSVAFENLGKAMLLKTSVQKQFKKASSLNFVVKPKHIVSKNTIKQLKLILSGRVALSIDPKPFPKKLRKKHANALKTDNVIWNTEENGLKSIQSIYGQNK